MPKVWPMVEAFLTVAAERSGERFQDWVDLLSADKMQLWVGWNGKDCEAAVLTELVKRQPGLTCQIVACGGRDMSRWFPLMSEIEQWAAHEGCVVMRVVDGRKGWTAMLPDYAVTGVTLERGL